MADQLYDFTDTTDTPATATESGMDHESTLEEGEGERQEEETINQIFLERLLAEPASDDDEDDEDDEDEEDEEDERERLIYF
jgi:hypothetical protein